MERHNDIPATSGARIDEGQRDFVIPASYRVQRLDAPLDDERPLPLLVALHGQGMTGELFLRILRHLPERPRLVLVPEGPYPFEKRSEAGIDVGHAWYIYRGDQDEFREHLERSEAHLIAVVDEVMERYPVDRDRVTLLGYSQGGYLAGFAGVRNPERFRALILASTRLKDEFLEPELARGGLPPTLFVHATNDASVPWDRSRYGFERLGEAGADTETFLHEASHRLPPEAVVAIGDWLARKGIEC